MMNPMVRQSTCRSRLHPRRFPARVTAAATTPMVGMVSPVQAWVARRRIIPPKMATLTPKARRLGMASPGSMAQRAGSTLHAPARSLLRKHR